MADYLGIEWRDANAQRKYPLAEHSTGVDVTGAFELPSDFLVSLYLPTPVAYDGVFDRFFLYSIATFPTGFQIGIGYDDGSEVSLVAVAVVARELHVENDTYELTGVGDFADVVGHVGVGRFDNIDEQPVGAWTFDRDGGALDPDCIRPTFRGVRSLSVVSGTDQSPALSGRVELVAGARQRITASLASGRVKVRFDAFAGPSELLNASCDCNDDGGDAITQANVVVRTINHVPPGPGGNFNIAGSKCLTIEADAGGIVMRNRCSEPCAGCEDVKVFVDDIRAARDGRATFENYLDELERRISQLETNMLGGMLNDRTCEECD